MDRVLTRASESGSIAAGVVSITSTRRRRFLWCAWLGGAPTRDAFRPPDHFTRGGARSPEDAHAEAERVCGVPLRIVEPTWARAWVRLDRGEPAFYARADRPATPRPIDAHGEALAVLGLAPGADATEIRIAFKQRALATHPDHGGDDAAFRAVMSAWSRLRPKRPR
jgi:hypothetical protein